MAVVSDPDSPELEPRLDAERLRQLGPEALLGSPEFVLEIGFGRAELIMDLAERSPSSAFLGVEVSRKRVEKAARRVVRRELRNCFLVHATAEYLLERVLPAACVSECWVCCPDPWPKKRHFKRRLIQSSVTGLLARVLRPGALLHVATDHPGYAKWISEVLEDSAGLDNLHSPQAFVATPPARRATAYELEWLAQGRSMAYFEYRRSA